MATKDSLKKKKSSAQLQKCQVLRTMVSEAI